MGEGGRSAGSLIARLAEGWSWSEHFIIGSFFAGVDGNRLTSACADGAWKERDPDEGENGENESLLGARSTRSEY